MGKGVKKKEQDKNTLTIRGTRGTYYSMTVSVLFEPLQNERGFIHPSMRELAATKPDLPTFNQDKISFTPAFKLPSDDHEEQYYQQKHKAKVVQYEPISEQHIMMPRPKDKRYCHVCECRFDDYQEHVDSEKHRKVLRDDKYQHRIQKLSRKIAKSINSRSKTIKTAVQSQREESFYLSEGKENDKQGLNLPQSLAQT